MRNITLRRIGWLLVAVGLVIVSGLAAQGPATELGGADGLRKKAMVLVSKGDIAGAIEMLQRVDGAYKKHLGEEHEKRLGVLNELAKAHQDRRDFAKAEPIWQFVLKTRRKTLGDKHPDIVKNIYNLAWLYRDREEFQRAEPLYLEALAIRKAHFGETHVEYAKSLTNLGSLYYKQDLHDKAEPYFQQALAIFRKTNGEQHGNYLLVLSNLAWLQHKSGNGPVAQANMEKVVAGRQKILGFASFDTISAIKDLGDFCLASGDLPRAEQHYERVLTLAKKDLAATHKVRLNALEGMGSVHEKNGEFARAEPCFREVLDQTRKEFGEVHVEYARILRKMAVFYRTQGDYARAEPMLQQALAIVRKSKGEDFIGHLVLLADLASLYREQGKLAEAEKWYLRQQELAKDSLAFTTKDQVVLHNDLGLVYLDAGRYAKAEASFRSARDLLKKLDKETSFDYGHVLGNLAAALLGQGKSKQGLPVMQQSLAITKARLGERHPKHLAGRFNLAMMQLRYGKKSDALEGLQFALEGTRRNRDAFASAQSERQQFAADLQVRRFLDFYLSVAGDADVAPREIYAQVLAWKGSIHERQQRLRMQRQAIALAEPETRVKFARLEQITRQLGNLALAPPAAEHGESRKTTLADLSDEKEKLEVQLAAAHATLKDLPPEKDTLRPETLQKSLPPGTVLVDFLLYEHRKLRKDSADRYDPVDRLLAFVVPADGEIRMVSYESADSIRADVDRWREALQRPIVLAEVGQKLRKQVWDPIAKHVGHTKMILISPDGALTRLPFAALPGIKADTYLLEEVPLAIVPVPRLLPGLLAKSQSPGKINPSLLIVGDVDFAAAAGETLAGSRVAPGNKERITWTALPGTEAELSAVQKLFTAKFDASNLHTLTQQKATERSFRDEAPKHRWLHLATHGYFAPANITSALSPKQVKSDRISGDDTFGRADVTGFHPSLLAGLVLAGANRVPDPGQDDGILTAFEVAELNLSQVDLAVLSACETGLGELAGGEGLLGLQRSFQVAGARSVVASLWSVPDQPTQVLMERFYANLWRDKNPLSKLESLREAQLWMLREGRTHAGVQRGVQRLEKAPAPVTSGRLTPYYWAAFVLSGDWR